MTNPKLEALWPEILRESKAALKLYRRLHLDHDAADDVASIVAMSLRAKKRVTHALIRLCANRKAQNYVRDELRKRKKASLLPDFFQNR